MILIHIDEEEYIHEGFSDCCGCQKWIGFVARDEDGNRVDVKAGTYRLELVS
ncbi:MAG: hypothetical protein GWO08_03130 [Gammaproteobacteria bacterium]|nr:hypothetical protein [Gammaproteobacteria bacterium]